MNLTRGLRTASTVLVVVMAASACSGGNVGETEPTTEVSSDPSTTSEPLPTTRPTTAESVSTTVQAAFAEGAATFSGDECVYEGDVEFPLNTILSVSFANDSEDQVGYSVWKVPDGRTTDDIVEHGILGIGTHLLTDMKATSQPIPPSAETRLDVRLTAPGSYAVNCFVSDGGIGTDFPAAILSVAAG